MSRALPSRVYRMPARFDSPCPVCGVLALAGDLIVGPYGPTGRAWCHAACVPTLYAAAGRPLPVIVERRSSETPTSHAAVNRAGAPRCARCDRRIILGRDGAPVDTPQGYVRHAVCPHERPGALPCGHRATYKSGPDKGACRACTRKERRA